MSAPEESGDTDPETQPTPVSAPSPEKMDYEFELTTICIKVTTNASGDAEPVNLTFSNFVDTDKLSTDSIYPYFIYEYAYPHNNLMTLPRTAQLAFFFDKSTFLRTMEQHVLSTGGKSIDLNISNYKNKGVLRELNTADVQPPAIAIANINTMIQILFPTIFPFPGNNISSFLSPSNNVPTPIIGAYSHFTLGGKPTTVIKTTWCDDCINHPVYKKLVTGYINLLEICKDQYDTNIIFVKQKQDMIKDLLGKITRPLLEKNKSFMLTTETNPARAQFNATDDQIVVQSLQNDIEDITKIANAPITTSPADDVADSYVITSITNLAINEINRIWTPRRPMKSVAITNTLTNDGNYKNILELLNRINERKINLKRTSFDPELFTIIANLHKNIVEYRIVNHVNKNYLSLLGNDKGQIRPGIQLDEELNTLRKAVKLDTDIMAKFYPTQYDEYIKSIQKVTQLTDLRKAPKYREVSPGESVLETVDKHAIVILDNFIKTPTADCIDAFNEMMNFAKQVVTGRIIDEPFPASTYAGITRKTRDSETDFEMYIHIDTIGGIITDENIRNVKCKYKDASIGEYFSNRTTESTAIIRPSVFVSL